MAREYLKPPVQDSSFIGWIRKNLFSSIPNSILTIVVTLGVVVLFTSLFQWGVSSATYTGGKTACDANLEYWRVSNYLNENYSADQLASLRSASSAELQALLLDNQGEIIPPPGKKLRPLEALSDVEKAERLRLQDLAKKRVAEDAVSRFDDMYKAHVKNAEAQGIAPLSKDQLVSNAIKEAGSVTNGACWPFVSSNFKKFMFGFYPVELDKNGVIPSLASATADNGTIRINGGGTVVYTPNAGFIGTDIITFVPGDATKPEPLTVKVEVIAEKVSDDVVSIDNGMATVQSNTSTVIDLVDDSGQRWRVIFSGALVLWTILLLLPKPSARNAIVTAVVVGAISVCEIILNGTFFGLVIFLIAAALLYVQISEKAKSKVALFLVAGCPIIALILFNGFDGSPVSFKFDNESKATVTVDVGSASAAQPEAPKALETSEDEYVSPEAKNDMVSTAQATPIQIDVLANDIGTNLVFKCKLPQASEDCYKTANGVVRLGGGNTLLYIPNDGFVGKDTFEYEVKNQWELVIVSQKIMQPISSVLPAVDSSQWGGLSLTLVLASIGIIGAFPLGILLALGRRSSLPIVKSFCVTFIEFWRGAPLITVIFIATLMIPLFFPPDSPGFNKLIYVVIGIIMFQSAYIAEVVRGGLQAVPKGQYEAGMAMGLTYWQSMRMIILPQALRISIPGIINQFISLFKDTSLVYIVSLYDLFTIFYKSSLTDPAWLGSYKLEGFAFIIIAYWVFCYGMSGASQKYEKYLNQKTTH